MRLWAIIRAAGPDPRHPSQRTNHTRRPKRTSVAELADWTAAAARRWR